MGGFRELEELFLSPFQGLCSSICILSSTGGSDSASVPEPESWLVRDVHAPSQRLGCSWSRDRIWPMTGKFLGKVFFFFFPSPSKHKTSSKMALVLVIYCSQQNVPKLSSFKQQLNIISVSVGQKSGSDSGGDSGPVSQEVAVKTSMMVAILRGISVQPLLRWRWRVSEVSSSSPNLQTPSPWLFSNTQIPV